MAQAASAGNLPALNGSFRRTLRAEDKSERTVKSYTEAVRLFADFLAERGHSLTVEAITRDDVRAFILPGDLDLDDQVVIVLGKGRRPRAVPYGRKTAPALDRYLRMRAGHPFAHLPNLWLGRAGAMTPSGLFQVVAARGAAGLPGLHPHQFRHSFADSWLSAGGNEGDLMRLAGWRSRQMVDRYAKSTEGTGGYGAGLTRLLHVHQEAVVELDRLKRAARRHGAKSDPLDAVRAAREVLGRDQLAQPVQLFGVGPVLAATSSARSATSVGSLASTISPLTPAPPPWRPPAARSSATGCPGPVIAS